MNAPNNYYLLRNRTDDSGKVISWDLVFRTFTPRYERAYSISDYDYDDICVISDIKDSLEAQCYKALAEYKKYFGDEFVDEEQMREKVTFTTKEDMAFRYCRDTIGTVWSLENAAKLFRPVIMETWICAIAGKKGICVDFKTCTPNELKDALADAIKKCIACYGSTPQKMEIL